MPQHDPLEDYTPDWRQRLDDPLTGYTPDWRERLQSFTDQPGIEKPSAGPIGRFLSRTRRTVLESAIPSFIAGVAAIPGKLLGGQRELRRTRALRPGELELPESQPSVLERASTEISERGFAGVDEFRAERAASAEGVADVVADVAGEVITLGATYIGAGGAVRSLFPRVLGRTAGTGVRTAITEALKDAAAVAPIDIATTVRPEDSSAAMVEMFADPERFPRIHAAASQANETLAGRAAFEAAFGFGADVLLRSVVGGVRLGSRLRGDTPPTAPSGPAPVVTEAEPRAFASTSAPTAPERVTAAAVRTNDGRIFQGRIHAIAVGEATQAGALKEDALSSEFTSGFLTDSGRFVERDEARKIVDVADQLDDVELPPEGGIFSGLDADDLPPVLRADVKAGEVIEEIVSEVTPVPVVGLGKGKTARFARPDEVTEEVADEIVNGKLLPAVRADDGTIYTRRQPAEHGDLIPFAEDAFDASFKNRAPSGWLTKDGVFVSTDDLQRVLVPTVDPRLGGASARAVRGLAGGGVGAIAGAAIDDEQPGRGATIGALAGLGIGARGLRATRGTSPAYLSSDAVQGVLATVSKNSALGRMTDAGASLARKLYTRVIDEADPLKRFGREFGGALPLAEEAARAKGYRGAARARLRDEFVPVIELARGHEDGVNALTKAQRALELLDAGLEKTDIPRDVLERTVTELSAVPEVKAGADALRGYYRGLLDHKLANGVIEQEAFDAIIAKGEYYIPFLRDFATGGQSGGGAEGRLLSGRTGIRKMDAERASAATVDPFEQAILDTLETERRVAKQRVTNMVAEIVERDPDAVAPFIRRIDNSVTPKHGRAVQANIGGKRQTYEVLDQELYDAWASFEPYTGNIFVRLFSIPKRTLQAGVTAMPDFGIANAIRDNAMSAIQFPFNPRAFLGGAGTGGLVGAAVDEEDRVRGAVRGLVIGSGVAGLTANYSRTLKAMRDIMGARLGGDPQIYNEWMREGGSGFGFYSHDAKSARRILNELERTGVGVEDIISPRSWWETLQTINRAIEEAPRLARYKWARERGVDVAPAIQESRDLSLDFARIGKHMKGMAATNAFLNAQIQGWDKLFRLLKEPKTWALGGAMLTAPSIALWTINKDTEAYWDTPQWERNLFWLIPKAPGATGSAFYRIPKPFEVGWIFASMPERILDFAFRRDPEALLESLKDVASTYGPGASLPLTTLGTPIIENIADFSLFTNRPIDPEQFINIPPEFQFTDRTSSVAVAAGQATGVSPAKIENVIRGYTGSLGGEVLRLTSRAARNVGLDSRAAPLDGRLPLVGRFLTRATQVSERELTIRRRFNKADATRNALLRIAETGDDAKAQAYYDRHRRELDQYDVLKALQDELIAASRDRREVRESDLDAEQKKSLIMQINSAVAQEMDVFLQRDGPLLGGRRSLNASPNR